MKELLKEQYEAPATKRTRVEMENGICATSVTAHPGRDVGEDRHVKINHQKNGNLGKDFDFSDDSWNNQ